MEQGGHRGDAALVQAVEEAAVEVEAALVGRAGAVGLDPGPGDGEAVAAQPEVAHEVEVLGVAVVVVDGHVAGVAVAGAPRDAAEGVPDRLAAPVLLGGALDLVRGGGRAPAEVVREAQRAGGPNRYRHGFSSWIRGHRRRIRERSHDRADAAGWLAGRHGGRRWQVGDGCGPEQRTRPSGRRGAPVPSASFPIVYGGLVWGRGRATPVPTVTAHTRAEFGSCRACRAGAGPREWLWFHLPPCGGTMADDGVRAGPSSALGLVPWARQRQPQRSSYGTLSMEALPSTDVATVTPVTPL